MISRRKFLQNGATIAVAVPLTSAIVGSKGRSLAPRSSAVGGAATTATAAKTAAPLTAVVKDTLSLYTRASFQPYLNTTFRIKSKRARVTDVKLVEIKNSGPTPDQQTPGRECFALLFRGQQKLPQDIYKIEHASLGRFDLLLVPMGPSQKDKKGMYYEALINRLV